MVTAAASNSRTNGDHDDPASTVVMEEEKNARKLLKEAGFDADQINKQCTVRCGGYKTPMNYFCSEGNLKMCRYLLSRGADCTFMSKGGWSFPMLNAATSGNLNVCRLLFL
mmetsp:Transcript_33625/g.38475  ORF Transcript_33625/g.38475 Transcript_33625/m.38475 type:complete len:111 (-) Transcript_33625:9-341(-)